MTGHRHVVPSVLRVAAVVLCCGVTVLAQTDSSYRVPSVRWEVAPVNNGAELLTFFVGQTETEIPIVSVLRDTLGSSDPEVHRLRYVWVHTYTSPSLRQRVAAGIPFLHNRIGNVPTDRNQVPREVADLSHPSRPLWKHIRGFLLKTVPFYPKPPLFDTAVETYNSNESRYRRAQLTRASNVLDSYDPATHGKPGLTEKETRELQGRLAQAQYFMGQFLHAPKLEQMYLNELAGMRRASAQNWELLRQRSEAEGLYFDPLSLPDGTATHALLWVSREDLYNRRNVRFDSRFLSIGNPWDDKTLRDWNGIAETWYFDDDSRRVNPESPGARPSEMIPLALYGLDHPRIPALLVDFRKPYNAKRRELSARARDVIRETLVPVSTISTLSEATVNFLTRRKGTDIFQPSRSLSYSQLKTILALDSAMSSEIRTEISRLVELVADNPFENDVNTEMQLARNQYHALLSFISQPDGLPKRLQRDRRAELAKKSHNGLPKMLLTLAEVASLGVYRHREKEHPGFLTMLEAQRRDVNYEKVLRDAAQSGAAIDVLWDAEMIRASLRYVTARDIIRQQEIADVALQIFGGTQDEETKALCLETIRQLEPQVAQTAFAALLKDPGLPDRWRLAAIQFFSASTAPPDQTITSYVQAADGRMN